MLAAAPHVVYIHEPFNIGTETGVNSGPFRYWYQHVCAENCKEFEPVFDGLIHYRYPLASKIAEIRGPRSAVQVIREEGLSILHRIKDDRPLIKDPIALFSAEWLCEKFNMNVLILIRHPAAFCSSLKIMHWQFNFDDFIKQPILLEKYLSKFEAQIRDYAEHKKDLIDQAILLWNCINHTINIYRQNHAEWLFVRHEDLSRNPVNAFKAIYRELDLQFSQKVRTKILQSSGPHNPTEQEKGKEFLRNSKENIYNWKKRLNRDEIMRIKAKTAEIASSFYSVEDW
jgi:hypothetical protein